MLVFSLCVCFNVLDLYLCCFFFKQKTAYEMRISDWSSDVCSSDLARAISCGARRLSDHPTPGACARPGALESSATVCTPKRPRDRLASYVRPDTAETSRRSGPRSGAIALEQCSKKWHCSHLK